MTAFAGMPFAALVAALDQAGPTVPAEPAYTGWIAANPGSPHCFAAWFNLGVALSRSGARQGAIGAYRNALALRPGFHPASLNLGVALEAEGDPTAALDAWRAAVQPEQERTALLNQQARLLESLGRLDEAERILHASLSLDPAQPDAIQHWVHIRQRMCLWPAIEPMRGLTGAALLQSSGPLGVLALTDDVAMQRDVAAAWIARKTEAVPLRFSPVDGYAHDRIRIGYLSSDFCRHAMSYLVAELFERHDRTRFQVFGYCASKEDGSALRRRVLAAFDVVRDIAALDDAAAARVICQDEIDVLIDLNGLTSGSRIQVLRWRPAPVQATYLGYVGSVPLPELDYLLCDEIVVPIATAPAYRPAPLVVGPTYQANDGKRGIGPRADRGAIGLPEDAFAFCCFANHYKITPEVFGAWMTILHQVDGAILWLAEDNSWSRRNLMLAAASHAIDPARLIFAPRCDPDTYMGRLAAADLFLDTFPYNSGTIASDALRMGLPLLTMSGRSFASRMAMSLLLRLNARDLVAANLSEYVKKAVRLGLDRTAYAGCKMLVAPEQWRRTLGDSEGFTRTLESAISRIVRRPLVTEQKAA